MAKVGVGRLGPAGPELLHVAARGAIAVHDQRWLRTVRHPAAVAVPGAGSFDDVYERSESLDQVYEEIADRLTVAATERGAVLYAVPGSPMVAERTVELLRQRAAAGVIELEVQ